MQTYGISEVRRAANISRTTLDQWISRGYFRPSQPVERGKARAFTVGEAMTLAAMAELTRVGVDLATASRATQRLVGFHDDAAVVMLWHASDDAPGQPPHHKVVRASEAADAVRDQNKRAIIILHLDAIEERVAAALQADSEGGA